MTDNKTMLNKIKQIEMKYSTVKYSTVQYSTVQYSTVQYSTVQYSTVQYNTGQYLRRLSIIIMLIKELVWKKDNQTTVLCPHRQLVTHTS